MARSTSRLQEEIKQTRPFSSIRQEGLLAVLKTADMLRRSVAERLEPFGLTPQQFNVLRIVRGAGPMGIPTLAIGERLIEETPGMTRLLDRLERKGLVLRQRCPEDRRQVLCTLTDEGRRLLGVADRAIESEEGHLLRPLTDDELEQLVVWLERIRQDLES